MIKVIDGQRYSTDTADNIYSDWNGLGYSDFGYRCTTLYRTKKGVWFIYNEGGAMTGMAEWSGNSATGGESITPVDDDDAYEFLETNSGDTEALEAIDRYFSERITDA